VAIFNKHDKNENDSARLLDKYSIKFRIASMASLPTAAVDVDRCCLDDAAASSVRKDEKRLAVTVKLKTFEAPKVAVEAAVLHR
jgi:hypothetical protein